MRRGKRHTRGCSCREFQARSAGTSGSSSQNDARDGGVVREDADVAPEVGVDECANSIALAEADLEGEKAAGEQCGVGLRNEAAIDAEAVGAGEEREVGFVVADFRGEGGSVGEGDIGWVGDDDVELLAGELGEQIGLEEANAVGEMMARGVFAGDGKCGRRDIGGEDFSLEIFGGKMFGESHGDGAGAGANVQNPKRRNGDARCEIRDAKSLRFFCYVVKHGLDEELGFGAGDESVGSDAEGEAIKFLLAGEVLERFVGGAASGECAELGEVIGRERVVDVGEDEGAIAAEDVGEKGFGVTDGDVSGGFGEGGAQGH